MFAKASFNQFATGDAALSNAAVFGALRRLPPGVVKNTILGATWAESWLRWPLATLKLGDRVDKTLAQIDPGGDRFGLTPSVKQSFKRYVIYNQLPDAVALLSALDKPSSRARSLSIRQSDILNRECAAGPGVIVVGFRTGPYSAIPWALAAAAPDRHITMIVSWDQLAQLGERLGETFIPDLNKRVTFVPSEDPAVLTKALAALKAGGVVATLLELSPVPFARKTPVDFLDWKIDVPYGISYLSAITSRPIIPAALTNRRKGFRLRFSEPIPAPSRDQDSMRAQAQALYTQLDHHIRKFPEQWIGWLLLESHMGIQLPDTGGPPLPASL